MRLTRLLLLFLITLFFATAYLYTKDLAHITGDYLFYSFDHNYIFGKGNIRLELKEFTITGERLDMDVSLKKCRITSDIKIISQNKKISECDLSEINIDPASFRCFTFGDEVMLSEKNITKKTKNFRIIPITDLESSLLYFIGREMTVKSNLGVYGKKVTAFIEGLQSVSFKSLRLNRGIIDNEKVFNINKLWYYNNFGILSDFSLKSKKSIKGIKLRTDNNIRINYDIFDKNLETSDPGIDFKSRNSVGFGDVGEVKLDLNYIRENVSQAVLGYSFPGNNNFEGNISIDLKKAPSRNSELWIRSFAKINLKKSGILSLNYNYEKSREYTGGINYRKNFGKKLNMFLGTTFSGSRISESEFNKISRSRINLNYLTKIFNLSGDYSFNSELLYKKSLSSPKLILNFIPLTFYKGLLNLNLSSTAVFNDTVIKGKRDSDFRSNTILGLSSKQIRINGSSGIEFSVRTEFLLNKDEDENFASGGFVVKGTNRLLKNTNLEIIYNYFTRRALGNWLIEGTAAADVTLLVKNKAKDEKSGFWGSLSYDIDTGKYTSSYFNFEIYLIKGWFLRTLLNYDFIFENFTYNIYLDRKAGRYKLRLSYRSLTRQLQLELIPN